MRLLGYTVIALGVVAAAIAAPRTVTPGHASRRRSDPDALRAVVAI